MTTPELCPVCDGPFAADTDPWQLGPDATLCFSRFALSGRCSRLPVDWRARTLAAEAERDSQREVVRSLRREIRIAQEGAERRNKQLQALGIVWCSGGCKGGMRLADGSAPTAEHIATLVVNAVRAMTWYSGSACRAANLGMQHHELGDVTTDYREAAKRARQVLDEWIGEDMLRSMADLGERLIAAEAERDRLREHISLLDERDQQVAEDIDADLRSRMADLCRGGL